jgi:hypothetical protein
VNKQTRKKDSTKHGENVFSIKKELEIKFLLQIIMRSTDWYVGIGTANDNLFHLIRLHTFTEMGQCAVLTDST